MNGAPVLSGATSCRFLVHAPLNRVLHEFTGAAEGQLFLDVRLVGFDSLHADVQFFGDLTCPVTFSDQTKHFPLAIAQVGDEGVPQCTRYGAVVFQHPV